MPHTSVLLHQSIDGLSIVPGDIFVDGTLGSGGHSALVASKFGEKVNIIGIDRDRDAIERSRMTLSKLSKNITLIQDNFRNIDTVLRKIGINRVNKILLDVGLSSDQLETSGRGFTFQKDEPLLMTFEKESPVNAEVAINEWSEESLGQILKGFGEERYAKKIAKAIAEYRKTKRIKTTAELVSIIQNATPKSYHHGRIHPATKTFQALRIAVNDELNSLTEGLKRGFEILESGGRIAVISFHSLEDRIVKQFFNEIKKTGKGTLAFKKPITPTEEEIKNNPRARSAKLRIIIKK